MEDMKMIVPPRHFRICPHCPSDNNTKQVKVAALGGIRPCVKHRYIDNPEALAEKEAKRQATRKANKANHKTTYRKTVKKKDKKVSKAAIEKQIQINRDHKATAKKIEKKVVSQKTDKELVDVWLKKNNPTIIQSSLIDVYGTTIESRSSL